MATRQEILSQLADDHEKRISKVLFDLEDDIIAELESATRQVTLNTDLAIQLRPNLKRLIEENYLKEGTRIVSDYDKVVKEYQNFIKTTPIADKFKTLTKPDLAIINQLKQLSFSGFQDVANRFLDEISTEVYKSAIVGKPFPDMVRTIRGQINGVYQRSNEEAINRLVRVVEENKYSNDPAAIKKTQDATKILQTKYAADRVGNNMKKYASQIAHDSLMQFDGQFTKYKAQEAGLTQFKYVGTNITTTREFCRRQLDKVFTEEEAREVWSQSWKGKSGGDPFIDRGGYRCRHSFIPYDTAWDNIDEVQQKVDPKKTRKKRVEPEKEVKPKSLVPDIAIGNLLNRGSSKVRKAYDDDFNSQLTDQQKNIVNKIEKPAIIKNGKKGYYSPSDNELSAELNAINKSKNAPDEIKGVKSFVIAHEYGHHIDYVTSGKTFRAWSRDNEDFKRAIQKDKRKFKGTNIVDGKIDPTNSKDGYFSINDDEALDRIFNDLATKIEVTIDKGGFSYTRKFTELREDGYAEVSDIIDALFKGRFRKNYYMWGHTPSYWGRAGSVEEEIFANLFAIKHNEKAYNLAKKYIPNTVKEFEKRLIELERL